jgi:CRP-like cAMP-binding protein
VQVNFLKSVPLLSSLPSLVLSKMSDVLEMETYRQGDYIIREATNGDTFYIIAEGSVRVTKKAADGGVAEEEEIRTLGRGDYFGEQVSVETT